MSEQRVSDEWVQKYADEGRLSRTVSSDLARDLLDARARCAKLEAALQEIEALPNMEQSDVWYIARAALAGSAPATPAPAVAPSEDKSGLLVPESAARRTLLEKLLNEFEGSVHATQDAIRSENSKAVADSTIGYFAARERLLDYALGSPPLVDREREELLAWRAFSDLDWMFHESVDVAAPVAFQKARWLRASNQKPAAPQKEGA